MAGRLDDRRYRNGAVDVRKLLLPALEVLVAHFAAKTCGIDVEQHEILSAPKPLIGDPHDLVSIGAVNETLSHQRVCRVRSLRLRLRPGRARRDVKDPASGFPPLHQLGAPAGRVLEDGVDGLAVRQPRAELLQARDQRVEGGADVAGIRRTHVAPDVGRTGCQTGRVHEASPRKPQTARGAWPRLRPPSTRSRSAAADGSGRPSVDRVRRHPWSWASRQGSERTTTAARPSGQVPILSGVRIHGLPRNRSARANAKPPRSAPPIGMTSDKGRTRPGQPGGRLDDVALGAADVGDDRTRAEMRRRPRAADARSARPAPQARRDPRRRDRSHRVRRDRWRRSLRRAQGPADDLRR